MKEFYLVFVGYVYYAAGGWSDMKGQCETYEEAQELVQEKLKSASSRTWYQIVHVGYHETKMIESGDNEAHGRYLE